jgi:hypothetical protein
MTGPFIKGEMDYYFVSKWIPKNISFFRVFKTNFPVNLLGPGSHRQFLALNLVHRSLTRPFNTL